MGYKFEVGMTQSDPRSGERAAAKGGAHRLKSPEKSKRRKSQRMTFVLALKSEAGMKNAEERIMKQICKFRGCSNEMSAAKKGRPSTQPHGNYIYINCLPICSEGCSHRCCNR